MSTHTPAAPVTPAEPPLKCGAAIGNPDIDAVRLCPSCTRQARLSGCGTSLGSALVTPAEPAVPASAIAICREFGCQDTKNSPCYCKTREPAPVTPPCQWCGKVT